LMASVWSLHQEQALLWCQDWRQFRFTRLTTTTSNSGKSGSGKSSAQSLLLRYFEVRSRAVPMPARPLRPTNNKLKPDEGRITLDGQGTYSFAIGFA
jgi:hypothetical protein